MSVWESLFTPTILIAMFVYMIMTIISLHLSFRLHAALEHTLPQWLWDHIGIPLLRASLMLIFIALAYPTLFGLEKAPSLLILLSAEEMRINYLLNLIFIITLLFPVIPVVGEWEEVILPLQGIAASALLFSWLCETLKLEDISYWPGINTLVSIILLTFITHYVSNRISLSLGNYLNEKFNVKHSEELLSKGIIIFIQAPIILLFSLALGKQL